MISPRLIGERLLRQSTDLGRSHQRCCTSDSYPGEIQPQRGIKMRNVLVKVLIGLAITAIGMFGADNSIGTWKRNVAKSTSTPPPKNPIKSLTIVNEASDGGIKVTVTGERQDGNPINSSYSVKYDRKEYPVTGAPWDTVSMRQRDANTFTFETKKLGEKYRFVGRTVISKDGKTMTTTTKGTNAEGQPSSGTYIYEKQ
jgi:hypothetical protein